MRDGLQRVPTTPTRHTVNLDLPPDQRWLEIGRTFANQSDLIIQYFESVLPTPVVHILDKVGRVGGG